MNLLTRQQRRKTRKGSDTNLYDFSGLIKDAAHFAKEKLDERAKRDAEEAARIARKKPRLTVVKSS